MSVYKRGAVWWIRFEHHGQEIRRSARTKIRAEAVAYERDLRKEMDRVARGGAPRRTYEDAMLKFIDEHLPTLKPAARRRYETSARMLNPYFDGRYLDEINKTALAAFISARKQGGASTPTIRRDLACLSSLFTCAADWDWIEVNPVRMLNKKSLPDARPRTRYLTHEEETALLAAAAMSRRAPYLAGMIAVAIDTGLRLEEQLSLTWGQVNLQRKEIALRADQTKSSRPRVVPLLPRSAQILAHLPRRLRPAGTEDWVFHKTGGGRLTRLTRALGTAAKNAKVQDLEWHDLRRTCGCRLLQDYEMEMKRVSMWLGHSSIVVTERAYAFLAIDSLHKAVGTIPGTGHADNSGTTPAKPAENMVPRGGIEPPTRGFSVRPAKKRRPRKTAE